MSGADNLQPSNLSDYVIGVSASDKAMLHSLWLHSRQTDSTQPHMYKQAEALLWNIIFMLKKGPSNFMFKKINIFKKLILDVFL